jgi:predicted AAA+ superfamily ATPase
MAGTLKPWREIAVPHEDVLKGTFQQAEFAADLSRVHDGSATPEYQDGALFYQRTFITEGMRLLLDSVVKRISGLGGDPVIQLQTAFGGGKTHTLLAVYHLAKGDTAPASLQGIPSILKAAKVADVPKAQVAVIDGNKLSPGAPRMRGDISVRTLWGELAWQLRGASGYRTVQEADTTGTSPGKEVLTELLQATGPCVILMDELVAYIRQFEDGKSYSGGSYDSNLSFIQALTEALKAVPTAMLLASLPESDREAGSQRGINALSTLEHYFGRVQALWKPVATEEAFEIVRRRLFTNINDRDGADSVCRAFADFYIANGSDFPQETQESRYYQRLQNAYPIHPEVFDRLYEDWSTLDNFQRTRGVLKLMAKVVHRLWKDGNNDLMIMPGSLPLYDADVRNEAIYYLPQGWDPVLEKDIDGERAETTALENKDTRLGSVQACRRVARTVFLGSAPTTANQMVRGIEQEQIVLGTAQPGQQTGFYKDALRSLVDRLHYLNSANDRFWFDTRPNLRREMEERKRRFNDKEDVTPAVRERIVKGIVTNTFGGIHVFTRSNDIPDDFSARLVVLAPEFSYSKSGHSRAVEGALEVLKNRGDQPRTKQNRLLFLAPDSDSVQRMKDQAKAMLAWQSIVDDIKDMKLNLDGFQSRQATKSLDDAQDTLKRMIRESYKWLLAPLQDMKPGKGLSDIQWEPFPINPGAQHFGQEIERALKENELLINEWSPIHLANLLKLWFWKDGVAEIGAMDVWQKTCQYLYMPRLKDEHVYRRAVEAGSGSRDFFGLAYSKEDGQYKGFSFGQAGTQIFDDALLLIETRTAQACDEAIRAAEAAVKAAGMSAEPQGTQPSAGEDPEPGSYTPTAGGKAAGPAKTKKRFYGNIELNPIKAKLDFATIMDEVIQHFNLKSDTHVSIKIDIEAKSTGGFDESTQRTIRENCRTLKFDVAEFEEE